ncbi:LysR family transcriptional regulator [Allostella vacuolata]|nr:LysR family transcriptional regulator [Stella vacuolata]
MMKLDGIAAFAAVAESGSISAAAIRMALSKSVVSDRLAELERALGTRLLQRTTRRLSLTEDGAAFLVRAQRMLRETEAAMAELAERRGTLAGPLRLSAPVSFGTLHLGPALYPFLAAHPGIELALELEDRFVDVAADGYDAVLRHGPIRDDRLVARRLAASRRLLVAAPAHLARHGAPGSLPELGQGRAILYANRGNDWTFAGPEGAVVVRPRAALRVNNGIVMRDAALAGLGIALLPAFLVHDALHDGRLSALDVGHEAEGADIYLAHPRQRGPSAKLDALVASLRRTFGDPPYWDVLPPGRTHGRCD